MKTTTMILAGVIALAGCAMDPGRELVIDRAWFGSPAELSVTLWTPFEGGRFELEGAEGTRAGEAACRGLRCWLTFRDVRAPRAVIHRVTRDEASASLHLCSLDHRFGLCPFGTTCVDGTCEPLCSPLEPDGACTIDGQICVEGRCGDATEPGAARRR